MAHIQHQNETSEERDIRVTEIVKKNAKPHECDFCTRKTWRAMTNIGSDEEKIFACAKCIETKPLLVRHVLRHTLA